jgi:hypothetical protein
MEALQAPLSTDSGPSPYRPIDSDGGEIRLVELWPGAYDDPITLSLHVVELEGRVTDDEDSGEEDSEVGDLDEGDSEEEASDGPVPHKQNHFCQYEYEALSYAWGTAISQSRVLVDGIDLRVTESLDQGLRRIRFRDRPRMLWIDALCINQRDITERSHQVQHTAKIYRSAKQVLIWLGEWPSCASCSNPYECQTLWMNMLREEERGSKSLIPYHIARHFADIVTLPWFSRLWVIQELALAGTEPIVLISSLTVRWSDLADTTDDILIIRWSEMSDDIGLLDQFELGMSRIHALDMIRSGSHSHQGLYWCLIISKRVIATNPRDKVYGLLGLCDFRASEPIVPDYSKSLQHVLAEATVVSILEESAFPYLDITIRPAGAFDRTHWSNPSWMIDFTSCDFCDYDEVYNAGLNKKEREDRRGSAHLSMDYRTLYAHGRYVGTVCETQNSSWSGGWTDRGFRDPTTNTEIYDFYHNILKPRGITGLTLMHAIFLGLDTDARPKHFASLLLGSRDLFRLDMPWHVDGSHEIISMDTRWRAEGGRDLFVTTEGHLGISLHENCKHIPIGAVLVCLFGIEVPFILAPVPGTQSHEMINVAYVPGYGDQILDYPYEHSLEKTWIDFAAEGGQEYAIV